MGGKRVYAIANITGLAQALFSRLEAAVRGTVEALDGVADGAKPGSAERRHLAALIGEWATAEIPCNDARPGSAGGRHCKPGNGGHRPLSGPGQGAGNPMTWMVHGYPPDPYSVWMCSQCPARDFHGADKPVHERREHIEDGARRHVASHGHHVTVQHGTAQVLSPVNYERPPERDQVLLTPAEDDAFNSITRGMEP
jgi:hypothetical protein